MRTGRLCQPEATPAMLRQVPSKWRCGSIPAGMIIFLGTTPSIQRAMLFQRFTVTAVNRATQVLEGPAGKSINAAKVAAVLGHSVLATGFVGGERGDRLRCELDRLGVLHDFVTVQPST